MVPLLVITYLKNVGLPRCGDRPLQLHNLSSENTRLRMSTKIINILDNEEARIAIKEVYKRAATDAEYREQLKEDPAAAFDAVGLNLGDWNVKFVEPTEEYDDVMQLPGLIEESADLSVEELEAVAGGAAADCCTFTCWYSNDNDDNDQALEVG